MTTPAGLADVTDFRQQLLTASTSWHQRFQDALTRNDGSANPGDCMAASYAYTLAATLKVVEVEVSVEAAERVGRIALEILDNGDFDNWNADLDH